MSSVQRVIKYCAMGFAIAILIAILTGITAIITGIDKGINWDGEVKYYDFSDDFDNIENLDLSNYSGKMIIKIGTVNKVVVDAKNIPETTVIKVKDNDTLYISDNTTHIWFFGYHFWGSDQDDSQITVILPIDFVAKKASFDNDSGEMEIRGLIAKEVEIHGGSGNIIVSNLKAGKFDICGGSGSLQMEKAELSDGEIDGGSGMIQISNSTMKDVDLDVGSGEFVFDGSLTGKNELDGGSGYATFNLSDSIDSYEFDLDAGSGGIYLNDQEIEDHHIKNKNAENSWDINGQSGKIAITFER